VTLRHQLGHAVVRGPDDVLSERPHWQIPEAEILYRGSIPFLWFRDPPTLLFGSL